MRLRLFLLTALLLCLCVPAARAEVAVYNDIQYIFPAPSTEPDTLVLSVRGEALDPETFQTRVISALPGAVFQVYAKDASGAFVPFPDPRDPSQPLTLVTQAAPVSILLPLSVDLYLRQVAAPEGFAPGPEDDAYLPLSLPGELVLTNYQQGMQGVRVELTADGPSGPVPLAGVTFTLAGPGGRHTLVTGEDGVASLRGLPPGNYTLSQLDAPDGLSIDEPEIPLTLAENEIVRLSVHNSQGGLLTLRALGLSADSAQSVRLLPIDRRYEVYDEQGALCGVIATGETLPLPAKRDGRAYTLRAADAPGDGYAADGEAHTVRVFPGQTAQCHIVVESEKGLYAFSHVSALDHSPVPGGAFAVYDASGRVVETFTPGADGRHTPAAPLPAGTYAIRMLRAAEGYQYADEAAVVTVEPFLRPDRPVAQAAIQSEPVPDRMKAPLVTADAQALGSLFERDARVSFTLRLFGGAPPLPVSDVSYALSFPDIEGLSVLETAADGATLAVARRYPLPGVQEISTLTVSGAVSYTYAYRIAPDETRNEQVSAPFAVEVASFAKAASLPAFAVSGHVTDGKGRPVQGLRVSLEDASGAFEFDRTVTDPFGAYAFESMPKDGRVRFSPQAAYGVLLQGNDAVLLPERTVAGRVVVHGDLQGSPVTLSLGVLGEKAPDADGRFSFTGVFAPDEPLGVSVPEGVLSRVEAGGAETVVHLYAAASVTGQIADPDGAPVAGALATLSGEGVSLRAETAADGSYGFDGLFPGEYAISIAPPEGYFAVSGGGASVSLLAGQAHRAEQTILMRPAGIAGTLTENGAPIRDVRVTLSPSGAEAVTGADGRFAFEGLLTGTYSLSVDLPLDVLIAGLPETVEIAHSGQRETVSLSVLRPTRLLGRVWHDENDDGLLSAGEGGLSGAAVTLLDERGERAGSAVTGADGLFAFEGLPPGAYRVSVTLPEAMIFARQAPDTQRLIVGVNDREGISDPIVLSSGQSSDKLLCGATVAGSVSGVVWEDLDGDGARQSGEPALQGVEIALLRGSAAVETVRTDEGGAYRFANVRSGDYVLYVSLPDGYLFTRQIPASSAEVTSHLPAVDARRAPYELSVRRWRSAFTVNVGALRAASFEAQVWLDENADGRRRMESGYGGVSVALITGSGSAERVVAEAVTGADGLASFGAVRPGAYRARYRLPSDAYGFTAGVAETANGFGISPSLSIQSGESFLAAAGISRYGSICGVVFADADYDGLRGQAEGGVAATVALRDGAGRVVAQTTAGADGTYAFARLFSGTYTLAFALPDGYAFTKNRDDAPSFNSDVPETKAAQADTAALFLPMGEELLIDAGAYRTAAVFGSVWHDVGASGRYAAGNPPLPGVAVVLLRDGEPYAQTLSGEDGRFAFGKLPPGSYAVRAELPGGMRFSETAGASGRQSRITPTEEAVGETPPFSLSMGQKEDGVDVGAVYTGSLSGAVQNAKTKVGMAGAQVSVFRNGALSARTQTGPDGRFRFDGLFPGAAEVRVSPPDGFALSQEQPAPFAITIPQRGEAEPLTVSLQPEAVFSGVVWLDANHDGVMDAGEAPLAGVTLSLEWDGGDVPMAEAVTGADGAFRFDKLLPGGYALAAVPPAGVLLADAPAPFVLSMGETRALSLAAFCPASISGSVFEDTNDDGLRAAIEPPLEGVRVELVDRRGNVLETAFTSAKGAYALENLPPVLCAVRFTLPDGYAFARRADGGSLVEAVDGPVGTTAFSPLSMGETRTDVQAGALRSVRIGDLVWLDENGNGLQDTGEMGVAGIRVTLWRILEGGLAEFAAETRTDGHGRYRFDGVRPGAYQASFDLGDQYLPTRPAAGLDQINSKLPWTAGHTVSTEPFTVQSGERALHIDAGVVTPAVAEALSWTVEGQGQARD